MSRNIVIVGVGLAVLGIILIARKTGAEEPPPGDGVGCFNAKANKYYHVTWLGEDKTLPDAFGTSAWNVIETVEFYDHDQEEWLPPADPPNTIIRLGEDVRFIVQEKVQVCGFRKN